MYKEVRFQAERMDRIENTRFFGLHPLKTILLAGQLSADREAQSYQGTGEIDLAGRRIVPVRCVTQRSGPFVRNHSVFPGYEQHRSSSPYFLSASLAQAIHVGTLGSFCKRFSKISSPQLTQ